MGGSVSQVFRSGSVLLMTHGRDGAKVSESTIEKVQNVFEILRTNPKVNIQKLELLLGQIAKYENICAVHDEGGYNLLQRATALNHVELLRYLLHRHCIDVNRSPCSLPLHIACYRGYEECVELLLKYGARIDTEARMCFPGGHSPNCEERGKYKTATGSSGSAGVCGPNSVVPGTSAAGSNACEPTTTKLQNALAYAIDGDQINVLNILSQKLEEPWVSLNLLS